MATFTGNTQDAASGSGGPVFVFDTITALTAFCPVTKVVFGNDAEIVASWSFNTGVLDDGTPRVTLATNDPAVAALEAIESYLDTEVAAILTGVQLIDDVVETNRFAVNLIAGQAGIAGGSGATTTNTIRTRTSSDDPVLFYLPAYDVNLTLISASGDSTATSLGIMDDWDELDRAKVNIIVGQAGVTAGAGAVAANTPRTTLASDDPAVTALQLLDNAVVDHGAAVVAGVRPIGLEGRSAEPTAVDSGDAVRALATLLGKQVTIPYAIPGSTWSYPAVSGGITDTADDVAKAAAGAGLRNYVTSLQVINGHASVSTEIVIKSGSTVIWRGWAQAGGGGVASPIPVNLRGGDNEAINVANITTGSQTYFNLQGFVAAE